MPDLLTHSLVAYGVTYRARRWTVILVLIGTVLPDVASFWLRKNRIAVAPIGAM